MQPTPGPVVEAARAKLHDRHERSGGVSCPQPGRPLHRPGRAALRRRGGVDAPVRYLGDIVERAAARKREQERAAATKPGAAGRASGETGP